MIPLRLELTNFLSYRKTAVLDFQGIHLACISGPNGAGKSSILDAMTWALFGQSRSKSDDDVVNRQASFHSEAADVRFDFDLEGCVYRIIRRKQAGKTMVLEFQMATTGGELSNGRQNWKSLSESKLRETQAAIETLLRMNFDTFSNASFLLQGKADEFTTKTANQRKEILADLLGVNRWDAYKELAAGRRKLAEDQLLLLDGRTSDIEQELTEEAEREAALAAAKTELEAISEKRALQEQLLEQLRRVEAAVKQQKQLVQNLAGTVARAQHNLDNRRQQRAQRQKERDTYQVLLDQAETIMADFAAWEAADADLQAWQDKAEAYNAIQQQRQPHELTVARERSRLEERQKELESQAQRVTKMDREREQVVQSLATAQENITTLTTRLAELVEQENAWREAREGLQQLENERKLLAQEMAQLQNQARRIDSLSQERVAVAKNLAEAVATVATLTTEVAAIGARHQRHAAAMAEMNTLQAEQPRLKEAMNKIKERLDRLQEETGGECPVCGQPLSENHRQVVLAELQNEGDEKGRQFRENKAQIVTLENEIATLTAELKQSGRLERDLQAQQQRHAKAEARLAEIDQALTEWHGQEDESNPAGRLAELEKILADDTRLQARQNEVEKLATAVQDKTGLEQEQQRRQKHLATAEARLAEIERTTAEWESVGRAELGAVGEQLASGQIVPEAQAALAALAAQVEELGYDPAAHDAARQARNGLAQAPARQQELRQAEAAVKPLEETLADLDKQIAGQVDELAELTGQFEEAETQLATMAGDGDDLPAVEVETNRLREEEITANRRVGAAQQKLAVLADLRRQLEKSMAERAEITLLIQRLKLLEKACGRDGVQALLIERALPEIEEDANELLERLTGGQMRVVFDTQRKLKSQDRMAETLDIRIADNVGERPYENFSGGEQFRVNFAVRLALSRILAKRAGARLQTLVIDEGFGSQDPSGRQRLVEAIHMIQNDFARILVITHIDELRDVFPSRIEVEKEATGSTITVTP